jgi:alkylated DNA repair dioxygenase AlkB
MQLFCEQTIRLPLHAKQTATLQFWPQWLAREQADALYHTGLNNIAWQSDNIIIAGKTIPIPRLHHWFSEPATAYKWSGIQMRSDPFPSWLEQLRVQVSLATNTDFNSCLTNYYRGGNDSVDWHADDEAILGNQPIVASVSLGAERIFQFKHRLTGERLDLSLPHGSLLLMGPGVQQYWHHKIPKDKSLNDARINFTFRSLKKSIKAP